MNEEDSGLAEEKAIVRPVACLSGSLSCGSAVAGGLGSLQPGNAMRWFKFRIG